MRLTAFLFKFPLNYSNLPKSYANLPERYIKRVLKEVNTEYETPKSKEYLPRVIKKRSRLHYGMHRPWTDEFRRDNGIGVYHPKIYVKPLKEWPVFRGDRVQILTGKDKGKIGIINYIVKERNWVTVEGLNCDFKTMGKTDDYPGVMYKDEQPLSVVDEVALIDPSDSKPTDIEWRYSEEGDKVRISVRTGRIIPFPMAAFETMDYKDRSLYPEQPKDTLAADLEKITFQPKLMTFEEDIMKEMGIEEHRVPHKTYWY